MLIIPFDRKINWSQPPLVTLLLVVANLFAFFIWQAGDENAWDSAINYYADSGLAAIEYPLYQDYLSARPEENPLRKLDAKRALASPDWVAMLQVDREFMERLYSGQLVTSDSPEYGAWKRKRQHFENLYLEITYIRYGWRTAEPDLPSLFSHMFLHAGIGHLLGNMLFLFAVGFLVEATLGRWAYLIAYLLSGVGAAGFDFLFRPDELIPGIGASGAISGLMGMYALLYWTRRIRFFYFFVVYFDYVTLPAIALLPMWLANEAFQLVMYTHTGVNYLAHLGGLCTGALVGFGARKWLPSYNLELVQEADQQQTFNTELDEARELCHQLEYRRALPLLKRLARQQPKQQEVLYYLCQCSRINPASEDYHRANRKILALDGLDLATDKLVEETFLDYLKNARPTPRLNSRLAYQLAHRFSHMGNIRETEILVRKLLRKEKGREGLAPIIEQLIHLLKREGEQKKTAHYQMVLKKIKST